MSLIREALPDFSWGRSVDTHREVVAGLVGALLVIPQAITFAYLAGVAPEHGLYCAVFVGFLASMFGNSPMMGGPNTAVAILLGVTVLPFAGRGSPLYTEFVLTLSLMVGLIQLCIWLLRGAAMFRYFSPAAIAGIKVGVGVLLITSAVEGALGLSPLSVNFFYEKFYVALASWQDLVNPYAATISGITIAAGLLLKRRWPRSYIIGAVLIGSLAGGMIYALLGAVQSQLELLGHVTMQALPLNVPRLGPQHWLFMEQVVPNALAIAVLGLAQSLVIARDLKATVAGNLDLHKEIFAQGISNALSPFFSTFAGSGSFNRTSVAVEMGAHTPLAGMIAACAVVFIAWVLGPFLTFLPMPVIAGVMALVGVGMIQSNVFRHLLHGVEGAVFLSTLLTVVFLGLDVGIFVAVLASLGFFVTSVSKVNLAISRDGDEERIAVTGNLFYASLDRLAKHLHSDPTACTVLDLSRVPYCDAAAKDMISKIQAERARVGGRLEIAPVT
ncbi:MAG TPA: SulP family inorganic anion transporter [Burkholderiales bacterium]|jgi:SulP family sulfate permease|nr:SulP family inorganic anion transporter [Burkholderiales bacterium]